MLGTVARAGRRMMSDLTVHSISSLYTMNEKVGTGALGLIEDGAVSFKDGKVVFVGKSSEAPEGSKMIDGKGMVGVPGLVDCHTHIVHAGTRSEEFGKRLAGATYTEILEAGGGILCTVNATRAATEEELATTARKRAAGMLRRGVTTMEIKSGYGLTPQDEFKMLKAAKACNDTVRVITTFLGAHTIPAEWRDDRDAYVKQVIEEQLPLVAPIADAIDVFCDKGAFTLEEGIRILQAGKDLGLKVKAHSEQVVHTGIGAAAAKMGAVSVDHLERLDADGVKAMKENGTVAVILPGAQVYLKDTSPPVSLMREAGIPMAVASDMNPGSSPVHDLWMCATLSCIIQGLTMEEALVGITINAGRALGRPDLGWLGEDSVGDMSLQVPPPGEPPIMQSLLQHIAGHTTNTVIRDGRVVV
eukprot:TRINITY_DN29769_c0_g1_i1.p1 TRINITY_DN29769_c0_g1~~TRINITY_DN29769_c0_g1_i1.p1  ORF type:complete len:427 (+),score=156.75 TRINITY_DN29769_c0_g1_i1:36-1283(+)